jgi:ankyrin repeat protein
MNSLSGSQSPYFPSFDLRGADLPSPQPKEEAFCSSPGMVHEEVDSEGKTPLFRAVEQGDYNVVKRLLASGCDPRLLSAEGVSMLTVAVSYFNYKVLEREKVNHTGKQYALIEELLSHGADACLTPEIFNTALILRIFTAI